MKEWRRAAAFYNFADKHVGTLSTGKLFDKEKKIYILRQQ